jgi:hypothetical protein
VVEDVARLGAFGIAAHPDSPKRELQWRAWDTPFDGLEIINLDTSWRLNALHGRSVPGLKLLTALATYPFRPVETIASLARPTPALVSRWEALTLTRRVVGIAGTDAHAKVALIDVDPGENRFTLPFPGYEPAFRALSVHVKPNRPLTGEAGPDASAVIDGLRAGKVYVSVDGLATPPSFAFEASNATRMVEQGDDYPMPAMSPSRSKQCASRFPHGDPAQRACGGAPRDERGFSVTAPGGWPSPRRIRTSDRPTPRRGFSATRSMFAARPGADRSRQAPDGNQPLFDGTDARLWRVEHTAAVAGEMAVVAGEIELRYSGHQQRVRLDRVARQRDGQRRRGRSVDVHRSIQSARRISVQLRTSVPGVAEERWQRTVYAWTLSPVRTRSTSTS